MKMIFRGATVFKKPNALFIFKFFILCYTDPNFFISTHILCRSAGLNYQMKHAHTHCTHSLHTLTAHTHCTHSLHTITNQSSTFAWNWIRNSLKLTIFLFYLL